MDSDTDKSFTFNASFNASPSEEKNTSTRRNDGSNPGLITATSGHSIVSDQVNPNPFKTRFRCQYCTAEFSSQDEKDKHEQSDHAGDKKYQCQFCPMQFAFNLQRWNHQKENHENESKSALCSNCLKAYKSDEDRQTHRCRFHCNVCKAGPFPDNAKLRAHKKMHEQKHCDKCGQYFSKPDRLIKHYEKCVESGKCKLCSSSVEGDMETHLKKECTQLQCGDCGRRFGRMASLQLHKKKKICRSKTCRLCKEADIEDMKEHKKECRALTCPTCKLKFPYKSWLEDHIRSQVCIKAKLRTTCRVCKKTVNDLQQHLKNCGTFSCIRCDAKFQSRDELNDHQCTKKRGRTAEAAEGTNNPPAKRAKRKFHCRYKNPTTQTICNDEFDSRAELYRHKVNTHLDPHHKLNWDQPPWIRKNGSIDEELRMILTDNRSDIFMPHQYDDVRTEFNFAFVTADWYPELLEAFKIVQDATKDEAVKVNAYVGQVLIDEDTKDLRYFKAGGNFPLMPEPMRVDRPTDWQRIVPSLDIEHITKKINEERPSTKWKLLMVTNVTFVISYLNVTMGCADVEEHVKKSTCIVKLTTDWHGHRFNDSHCAVRALAYHHLSGNDPNYPTRHNIPTDTNLRKKTLEYAKLWNKTGLRLEKAEIERFENVFNIDVDIFNMQADKSVYPIFLSNGTRTDKLTLNQSLQHLSYVSNVQGYLKKFKCTCCDRHFRLLGDLRRHIKICTLTTLKRFNFEHYKPPQSMWDSLAQEQIVVPPNERQYKWFAVYGGKSALIKTQPIDEEKTTQYIQEHRLCSNSVSSNVNGYEKSECFCGKDPQKIMNDSVAHLKKIQAEASRMALEKWDFVLDKLKKKMEQYKPDHAAAEKAGGKKKITAYDRLNKLHARFIHYCKTLPVLSFGGASYDLNVMKPYLFPALGITGTPREDTDETQKPYIIKKNNSYVCVQADHLRFLDICQYLAPGTKYTKFLKSYQIHQEKTVWPYDWFDNVEKLDDTELPAYEKFSSIMKDGRNLLNLVEREEKEEDMGEDYGRKQWMDLKNMWNANQWNTMADYLSFYNNLDTKHLVKGIEKLLKFFFNENVDVFKSSQSMPGISRAMLFDTARKQNISFASVLAVDEDLYYSLRRNIISGPSILFSRNHEVGRTFLHGNQDYPCLNIEAYDANSLYVWALDQNMPCGSYVRRYGPNFQAQERLYRKDAFDWLDYMAETKGVTIQHARNFYEVKEGEYKLDGWDPVNQQAYEFDGCYYHKCPDCKTRKPEEVKEAKAKAIKRRALIKAKTGNDPIEMTECKYKKLLMEGENQSNSGNHIIDGKINLFDFVEERLPKFYKDHRRRKGRRCKKITSATLLDAVLKDEIYGIFEVDLKVKDSDYEKFSEMSPIFCTVDIPHADIGEYMQDHCKKHNISESPRNLLVGGMAAEKLMVHTDLLKWYLEHGLEVTKIYQVIEFKERRCFREFVKKVTEARRQGDRDETTQPIADTFKYLGNGAYGSILLNKEKFNDTKYMDGHGKAELMVNDRSFRSINKVNPKLYEVNMAKKSVYADLPIQLGFTILQLAKLKMLQFYYDFLQRDCDNQKFQMLQMDTDSNYLALSGQSIRDIIKPDMKAEFEETIKHKYCSKDAIYTPEQGFFLPRECCTEHKKYDKRTPGLFKLEASGVEMISLCSKTYSLKKADGTCKYASKGLNKNAFFDPHAVFKEVLETGVSASGTNRGVVSLGNTTMTYYQKRAAIQSFYCKRQVMADGVSTRPLPTVLKPWPTLNVDIVGRDHILNTDKEHRFGGEKLQTLTDVCVAAMKFNDPDKIVKEALSWLQPYKSSGDLLFPADCFTGFNLRKHSKNSCYYWTSGMTSRTLNLVAKDKHPGQNKLGLLWQEICAEREEMDTSE